MAIGDVRDSGTLPVDEGGVAVQLEAKGPAHCGELLAVLREKGYALTFG